MTNRSIRSRLHTLRTPHPARAGRLSLAGLIALAVAPVVFTSTAFAGPEGGAVTAGQARVSKAGNMTTIQQQSSRAVIDWRSFNVGASEAVTFAQPDARSATLNRILGTDGSTILGHITANGSVYLVNPNGVLFGSDAQVNVGALVASTANITNANFMAGNDRFDQPGNASAKVENRGTIRIADRGIAALVGRQVSNSGFILATLGKVALAGGDAFVLDMTGDRLVNLILDPAALEQVRDAQGVPLIARVDNTGNIQANGGRIEFSADTVSRLLDNVINVQGDVRAVSVDAAGGVISLRGGATTDATLGGVLQPGGRTGLVDVSGRDITLMSSAQFDLGQGADLHLAASRNLALNAPLNGLRSGSVAGASVTASAGQDLTISQNIALNDGALSLTATSGRLTAAGGTVLQAGNQAISLRGGAGVSVDRVLTSGAVDIASAAGAVDVTSAIVAPSATATDAVPVARLSVSAALDVTLAGALASGDIEVRSGADLTLRSASIESRGGNVGLRTDGRVGAADAALGVVAGSGNATIAAGGDLDLPAIIASGDIALTSGGKLAVAQTLGGAGATASRSVGVDGGGDVSLAAGAHAGAIRIGSRNGGVTSGDLVASGGVSVVAGGGHAGTAAAPLKVSAGDSTDAAGGVSIEGRDGIAIATLVTPGAVLLRSGSGGVAVASAITGSTASDLAAATPARTIRIEAAGDVDLSGARAGAGGVTVTGPSAGTGAGNFTLNDQPHTVGGLLLAGGSLLSDGDVSVTSIGALRTDALVLSGGTVSLTSIAGPLTIGTAGVRTTTPGRGISLLAAGDLNLNGDLQAQAATISVTSSGGAVTALVGTAGADPVAGDATIEAGSDAQASKVAIAANGDVTLGGVRSGGSVLVSSANGNVMLLSPLGGANTGYAGYANGYQSALRPDVGTLTVSAPKGSIELNGLNLDGLADPHAAGNGLFVSAGRMVLSNGLVAVNKGDIVLQGGSTQASDGVYLGNSVYSRGWDSVGSDGVRHGPGDAAGDDDKLGYSIRIAGRNLGLFDNTTAVADLPGLFTVTPRDGTKVLTDAQAYLVDNNGARLVDAEGNLSRAVSATSAVSGGSAVTCGSQPSCVNDIRIATGANATSSTSDDSAVLGLATSRTVAKIEVANNVANFQDIDPITHALSSALVPTTASAVPKVVLDTDFVGGVVNSVVTGDTALAGRLSLRGFTPVLGGLSAAPASVTPAVDGKLRRASTRGVALKLLGFETAQDASTEVWNDLVAFAIGPKGVIPSPTQKIDFFTPLSYGVDQDGNDNGKGRTFQQVPDANGEGLMAPPVNGAFKLIVKDINGCGVLPCTEIYELQRLTGALSSFAQVKSATLVYGPKQVDTLTVPTTLTNLLGVALDTVLQIRFAGAPTFATRGSAGGVQVRGTVMSAGEARFGGSLTAVNEPAAQSPLVSVTLPPWSQGADGTLTPQVFNLYSAPTGYVLGRSVVDSSTSNATYPPSERGTRVEVFDGILDTQLGRVISDSNGGVNFIPGFGGIQPGKNNSTTGFTSVGASVGSSAGRSGATATSVASARPVSGTIGTGAGAAVGAAPTAASDPGFVPHVDVADRSAQDALTAADPKARTNTGDEPAQADLIEIGLGPAAMADLGRNGSLGGATNNVFKRSYQVAASSDAVVCAPGAIAQRNAVPRPAADGTATSTTPSPAIALARDCKPSRR